MPGTTDSPHVLHALLSLEYGGMEQVVVDLVHHACTMKRRVDVLCLERPGELASQVTALGATVHCLNKRPGIQIRLRKEISGLIQKLRPDVLHTHQIGALFYSGPAARKYAGAVLHTEHGKEYDLRRRTRWLGRIASLKANRFCCVSEDTAKHVRKYRITSAKKIEVVYNGIDLERFRCANVLRDRVRDELSLPRDAFLVGTVGRLSEIKRQDVLIRAFAILAGKSRNSHLILVGDGPQRNTLMDLSQDLGLSHRIHFVGYQPDRERYLAAMDVFTLSSDSEGTPLALLEAWATGLPIVATTVGGLPELVDPRINGLLVPPRNAEVFSAALQELMSDSELLQSLGTNGAETARSCFDRGVMASRYDSIYRELLANT